MKEILERQLLFRGRASATFSTIEKALVGRKESFGRLHASHGPYVVKACYRRMSTNYWSEWWWAFSFNDLENWQLLCV